MNITLTHRIPEQDGYFLMKFVKTGGLHLVLIQTRLDGRRFLIPDNYKKLKNPVEIDLNDSHSIVFKEAVFSEEPINIIV